MPTHMEEKAVQAVRSSTGRRSACGSSTPSAEGGPLLLTAAILEAAPVKVVHREGLVHGYLSLDTREGRSLAEGESSRP